MAATVEKSQPLSVPAAAAAAAIDDHVAVLDDHHDDHHEQHGLSKVDSAVSFSHDDKLHHHHRPAHRRPSDNAGVRNIKDLEKEGIEIAIAPETQKLNWKLNTSPSGIEDKEPLKKLLTTPPVKKIDLHFPLGLNVTARNMRGVTIKDALDAIYKQYKHKADDELELPYLMGFEWDKRECWTRFIVHQKREGGPAPGSGKKGKSKKHADHA